MSLSNREQLWAFLALIASILILGLAPLFMSGFAGRTLPDSLIAVSDKTVTGLVGVLGTVAAMVFRTNRTDDARVATTQAAFEAVTAATKSNPQPVTVVNNPDEPVPVEAKP